MQHGSPVLWRTPLLRPQVICLSRSAGRRRRSQGASGLLSLQAVCIARITCSSCVLRDGKIAFLREYFDPVRAARALGTEIPGA